MNPNVLLSVVVACAMATPIVHDTICVVQPDPITSSTTDGPVPHIHYRLPTPIPTPFPGSPVMTVTDDKSEMEYDFPAPISAPPLVPVGSFAGPLPVQIAATRVHGVPEAIETRVHYAETPVFVGHTSHIMKPNLGAGAHVTSFDFMGIAQTKTAAQESYVQKSKVLAPARGISEITPQVTVQHPTKVNVQKVAVEVPVAAPYAHPVPVAPQYEIHQYHQSRHFPAAFPSVRFANSGHFTRQRKQETIKETNNQESRKVLRKIQGPPSISYRYAHFLSALESPRHFHRMLPRKTITNFSTLDESAEDRESHETYDN